MKEAKWTFHTALSDPTRYVNTDAPARGKPPSKEPGPKSEQLAHCEAKCPSRPPKISKLLCACGFKRKLQSRLTVL